VFAVIYRWRLKSGMEEQFIDGWERVTRAIQRACGSYGSRLHRCDDGLWLAYACWPDETTQQDCEHGEIEGLRLMQQAAEALVETVHCEVVTDLLQEPASP
jgi:heme-degrading monooxygenase HmoA